MAKYHPARIKRVEVFGEDLAVAERLLWKELRVIQDDGLQFRRHVQVQGHTVDMLCQKANVVIHLFQNGEEPHSYDTALHRLLENQGYKVVQVRLDEIVANVRAVAESIREVCLRRTGPVLVAQSI